MRRVRTSPSRSMRRSWQHSRFAFWFVWISAIKLDARLVHCNVSCVQMLGQPIQDRHREHEDRPRAFEELGKKLQIYMKALDAFKQKVNF